jgi:hypothetical protein
MDKERALNLAREARSFSNRGLALIKQGDYLAGHSLMRQAVEAGRESRNLINEPRIINALTNLTELKSQG